MGKALSLVVEKATLLAFGKVLLMAVMLVSSVVCERDAKMVSVKVVRMVYELAALKVDQLESTADFCLVDERVALKEMKTAVRMVAVKADLLVHLLAMHLADSTVPLSDRWMVEWLVENEVADWEC